jgi:hypothetical protein
MTIDLDELADHMRNTVLAVRDLLATREGNRLDIAQQALRAAIDIELEVERAADAFPGVAILGEMHDKAREYAVFVHDLVIEDRIVEEHARTGKWREPGDMQ